MSDQTQNGQAQIAIRDTLLDDYSMCSVLQCLSGSDLADDHLVSRRWESVLDTFEETLPTVELDKGWPPAVFGSSVCPSSTPPTRSNTWSTWKESPTSCPTHLKERSSSPHATYPRRTVKDSTYRKFARLFNVRTARSVSSSLAMEYNHASSSTSRTSSPPPPPAWRRRLPNEPGQWSEPACRQTSHLLYFVLPVNPFFATKLHFPHVPRTVPMDFVGVNFYCMTVLTDQMATSLLGGSTGPFHGRLWPIRWRLQRQSPMRGPSEPEHYMHGEFRCRGRGVVQVAWLKYWSLVKGVIFVGGVFSFFSSLAFTRMDTTAAALANSSRPRIISSAHLIPIVDGSSSQTLQLVPIWCLATWPFSMRAVEVLKEDQLSYSAMSLSTLNDIDIDDQEHHRTVTATVTSHSEWEPKTFSLFVSSFNFVTTEATAVRTIVPYNRVRVSLQVLVNYGAGTWDQTLRYGCKIAEVGWRGVVLLNRAAGAQDIRSWLSLLGRRGAVRNSVKALKRLRGPRSVPRPLRINIGAVTWERAVFDHQGLSRFELQTPNFASARSGQLFFADADRDIRTAQFNRQAQLGHVIPTAAQDFGVAAHIKGEVDE